MANEFYVRKGLIVSGSTLLSGSLNVTQGITGSLLGTSSYANNADLLDGLNSTVFATTGSNTFVGNQIVSGSLTTSGSDATINSVTVGIGAGNIDTNTVVGNQGLQNNTTGNANTAIGYRALRNNTTGTQNTAVGAEALLSNTVGGSNVAIGRFALFVNQSGSTNIAVGRNSLVAMTTGSDNCVVGSFALNTLVNGSNNIAIGRNAGTSIVTGSSNTIIGSIAGETSLSNTVIIGAGSAERLRIDSSGNMGLGTTSPTARLTVSGDTHLTGSLNVSSSLTVNTNTLFADATNNRVGIGTTSPTATLTVTGSANITGSFTVVTGSAVELQVTNLGVNIGSAIVDTHNVTGSLRVSGSAAINGNSNITGSLDVTGAFTAQTKSFKIQHQTQIGKSLVYGVLEGAEHAVYARGKLNGNDTIELPDEWTWLVDEDSITVQLTPINNHQKLYVQSIHNNKITVGNANMLNSKIHCYYIVHATRKDVDPLVTVV